MSGKRARTVAGIKLREDEKLLVRGHISLGIYWKALAVLLLSLLIGLLLAKELGVFLLLVSAVVALGAFLTKKFLFIALTNERVLVRRGIIKIDTLQLRLDSLESVEVQRTIVGQLLGYASVVITGVGSRFTIVPFVENAVTFRDALDDVLYSKDNTKK